MNKPIKGNLKLKWEKNYLGAPNFEKFTINGEKSMEKVEEREKILEKQVRKFFLPPSTGDC